MGQRCGEPSLIFSDRWSLSSFPAKKLRQNAGYRCARFHVSIFTSLSSRYLTTTYVKSMILIDNLKHIFYGSWDDNAGKKLVFGIF